jgi:hypothetical protein
MILKDQCKHGFTYRIHSRNLTVGVYDSRDGSFVGIREKFGNLYLFPEFHYDNGPPYGTVSPVSEIEKCPVEDIRSHLDTLCGNCKVRVDWKRDHPEAVVGKWFHLDPSDCNDAKPVSQQNKALYDYLEDVEKKVEAAESKQ